MNPIAGLTIENLPRIALVDPDNINAAAQFEPVPTALTFVVDMPGIPFSIMYAPKNETTLATVAHINNFTPDDDVDAFVLFFKRMAIGGAIDANIRALLTISHTSGKISGGSATELIREELLGGAGDLMRRLNVWLQQGDTYQKYLAMDPSTELMCIEAKDGVLTSRILTGRERPDMRCFDFQLFSFGDNEPIISCRPYADEMAASLARDSMSLEEKREAAENGDADCMEALAMTYLHGDDETEADPEKSFYWMKRMAEAGNATGMYNAGLYYAKGFGTERDLEQAAYWMEKAMEAGDEDAPKNAKLFRKMAEEQPKAMQGDAAAQGQLARGFILLSGCLDEAGPEKDFAEALRWAQRASEQGDADGLWVLGRAYQIGRGVETDMTKAAEYFRRGAELKHPDSMNDYALLLMQGEYAEQDEEQGFRLIKQSAEAGYGAAMANLARCYQHGTGCEENMEQAIVWYEKAGEALDNDELRSKAQLYKMLQGFDLEDEDEDEDEDEEPHADLPEGYEDALAAFMAEDGDDEDGGEEL